MVIPRGQHDGGSLCFSPTASFSNPAVCLHSSKNCFEHKRNSLKSAWLGLSSQGQVCCQLSCAELCFGGVRAAPGAAWGVPLRHRLLRGASRLSCGVAQQWCLRVSGCMRVCVWECLLMQEHVDSPGVAGFSLMGTRVPDVAWNVTAGGFSNLFWAFPSFREAFFHATFATRDLVHLKRASGWTR